MMREVTCTPMSITQDKTRGEDAEFCLIIDTGEDQDSWYLGRFELDCLMQVVQDMRAVLNEQ